MLLILLGAGSATPPVIDTRGRAGGDTQPLTSGGVGDTLRSSSGGGDTALSSGGTGDE